MENEQQVTGRLLQAALLLLRDQDWSTHGNIGASMDRLEPTTFKLDIMGVCEVHYCDQLQVELLWQAEPQVRVLLFHRAEQPRDITHLVNVAVVLELRAAMLEVRPAPMWPQLVKRCAVSSRVMRREPAAAAC